MDFGFIFCEVSHFYSMSYEEVLRMPMKTFWLMSGNIRRIRAGYDLRTLATTAAAGSPDGVTELQERLVLEIGDVVKQPATSIERDEAGFAELKAMATL